jgi:hypothetical protein
LPRSLQNIVLRNFAYSESILDESATNHQPGFSMWLGLSDADDEGSFVWKSDGRVAAADRTD